MRVTRKCCFHNVLVTFVLQSKLPAVLRIYRDTLITDIKAAIKVVVAELLPVLVSKPIDTDTQAGERHSDIEGKHTFVIAFWYCGLGFVHGFSEKDCAGVSLASKLRSLTAESFVQLLTGVFDVIQV